jgi:3-deoxy-D-manno-octulosonic-acid transferase
MRTIYTLSILFYQLAIHFASFFNQKAKLWVDGRVKVFEHLKNNIPSDKKVVWFHCASLGEFEQGRSVIENYRKKHPTHFILLTFFSPSGYEIRKNYNGANYICYLPIDSLSNSKQFIKITKPHLVFFIKYEFWFNYLNELKKSKTPTFLISGIFRSDQQFFKWYGGWFRKQLQSFNHFFLQNKSSIDLLSSINYTNTTLAGDTRFDRVIDVVSAAKPLHDIAAFVNEKQTFVAGSTWPDDEKILVDFIRKNKVQLIIAPHEVNASRIKNLQQLFGEEATLYSAMDVAKKVLIIDSIGLLSSLYAYGTWAYIGGGFGSGIHNTLEAASYGIPVVFGPNFQKFQEAKDLIEIGAAESIATKEEFEHIAQTLFQNDEIRIKKGKLAREYVYKHQGATKIILDFISQKA